MPLSKSPSDDFIHRFFFDHTDLRGEIVTLQTSFQTATAHHPQHPVTQRILGEFFAAVSLLAGVLKFEGMLTLQIRGNGIIPVIMAEATHERKIRGIVQGDPNVNFDEYADAELRELVGDGVLTITIDPTDGQRYQGIIAIDGTNLAECLSHYFAQSEQLPTRLWLSADGRTAGGLLLQALPPTGDRKFDNNLREEEWNHAVQLANTVKSEELFNLPHAELLYRLFNEFELRLMPPEQAEFYCNCSRQRSGHALLSLGEEDAYELLTEQPVISINCQFCGQEYVFQKSDLADIFHPQQSVH